MSSKWQLLPRRIKDLRWVACHLRATRATEASIGLHTVQVGRSFQHELGARFGIAPLSIKCARGHTMLLAIDPRH
jgi:hypothetical protein